MPVPSSGQLSLRNDIALEVGGSSTANISLRNLSSAVGFSTPDAMSEFYGYSRNRSYFETRRGHVENSYQQGSGNNLYYTMMGWFRVNSTYRKSQNLFSMGRRQGSRQWQIRAYYFGRLNRIQVALWDSGGVRRMRREYPLHNSPNVQITGVTSSGTGWMRNQRGNTDADGFVHLAATFDTSTTSYTGLRFYWNGQELTYSVNNNSSSTYQGYQPRHWVIQGGQTVDNAIGSTNNFEGSIDNLLFDVRAAYSQAHINDIYQKGNVYTGNNHTFGGVPFAIHAAQGFENGLTDQSYLYPGYGNWQYQGSSYSIQYY